MTDARRDSYSFLQKVRVIYQVMCDEADSNDIWVGSVADILRDRGINHSKYKEAQDLLEGAGLIQYARRGGGAYKSSFRIIQRIDPDSIATQISNSQVAMRRKSNEAHIVTLYSEIDKLKTQISALILELKKNGDII